MYIKSLFNRFLVARLAQKRSRKYWIESEGYNYQQNFPERYRKQVEFTEAHLLPLMKPTDAVIDFGCADAWHALLIAPHCACLHGYDLSDNLVELAKKTALQEKVANCTFEQADVLQLSLEPETAEVVLLCGLTTCLVRDVDALKGLRLAAHVLRPNGLLLLKDTLATGDGTQINCQLTYGAVYRSYKNYKAIIEKAGFTIKLHEWIDQAGDYGSIMALARKV